MGGFEAARGAGRAGAGADAVLVEHEQDGFAFDELKRDAGGVGQPVGRVAVDLAIGHGGQDAGFEAVAQGLHPGILLGHVLLGQGHGRSQGDDAGGVLGAGPAAAFLVAADEKRPKRRALAHVQHADALGRVELVAGQRQHVHGQLGQIDVDLAHGLDRVGVEQHALGLAQGGDLRDGENDAGFVVGVHDRDDGRVLADGAGQLVKVQVALVVNAEIGDFVALFFQVFG